MAGVLGAAAALFGLQALVVAAVSAVRPRGNVYAAIVAVSLATAPLALLAERVLPIGPLGADGRLHLVLLHLALGGFLFHFMTLPDRSVTLRILVEALLAPGGRLTTAELGRRYGVRTMITSRVDQLVAGGFLDRAQDGSLSLTGKGAAFGRFVAAGRRLFDIESAN